ncbi:DUF6262 family protein [Streptomyces sp. NPDC059349]|uniref:DUF6262 family protein n=1 Tax=Streptomyces sp. NPDC059349 TaxID=3346808 RepID=UPI00368153DA
MSNAMTDGRKADSARRRQRVIKAINNARRAGEAISVSLIARQASVDRTFLYRYKDLLAEVHAAELEPGGSVGVSPVSRASLQADLVNAQARKTRLAAQVQQLQRRLSEAMGERVWKEAGLGAPADLDALERKTTRLEQENAELKGELEEARADLEASRAANRDLTRALNHHDRREDTDG